jgi:DNA ligase (NAD+)
MQDVLQLEGFAEKRAENLLAAIDRSRSQSLPRLIIGLGIRNVGESVASDLARHFGSVDRLAGASITELETLEGIGPIVAQIIYEWFQNPTNLQILNKLKTSKVQPELTSQDELSQPQTLSGLSFVITGTLSDISRTEAKELIQAAGGRVVGSVSGKTDYLVAGDSPGSKLQKAVDMDIPILTKDELLALIASGP